MSDKSNESEKDDYEESFDEFSDDGQVSYASLFEEDNEDEKEVDSETSDDEEVTAVATTIGAGAIAADREARQVDLEVARSQLHSLYSRLLGKSEKVREEAEARPVKALETLTVASAQGRLVPCLHANIHPAPVCIHDLRGKALKTLAAASAEGRLVPCLQAEENVAVDNTARDVAEEAAALIRLDCHSPAFFAPEPSQDSPDDSPRTQRQKKQDELAELESAVVRIQAATRGRQTRMRREAMKTEDAAQQNIGWLAAAYHVDQLEAVPHGPEVRRAADHDLEHAAVKIQAAHRGRQARHQLSAGDSRQKPDDGAETRAVELDDPELQVAAIKIQAAHRGRQARQIVCIGASRQTDSGSAAEPIDVVALDDPELEGAAVKIQAAHRDRQARQQMNEQESRQAREDTDSQTVSFADLELEGAAVKIQAVHRGRQARQQMGGQGASMQLTCGAAQPQGQPQPRAQTQSQHLQHQPLQQQQQPDLDFDEDDSMVILRDVAAQCSFEHISIDSEDVEVGQVYIWESSANVQAVCRLVRDHSSQVREIDWAIEEEVCLDGKSTPEAMEMVLQMALQISDMGLDTMEPFAAGKLVEPDWLLSHVESVAPVDTSMMQAPYVPTQPRSNSGARPGRRLAPAQQQSRVGASIPAIYGDSRLLRTKKAPELRQRLPVPPSAREDKLQSTSRTRTAPTVGRAASKPSSARAQPVDPSWQRPPMRPITSSKGSKVLAPPYALRVAADGGVLATENSDVKYMPFTQLRREFDPLYATPKPKSARDPRPSSQQTSIQSVPFSARGREVLAEGSIRAVPSLYGSYHKAEANRGEIRSLPPVNKWKSDPPWHVPPWRDPFASLSIDREVWPWPVANYGL